MLELANVRSSLASLMNLASDIQDIKQDIGELKTSMGQYSAQIKKLDERLVSVEKTQNEIPALKAKIAALEDNLNDRDQWMRLNNVEIKGVPMKNNENLIDIAMKIGNKIMYYLLNNGLKAVLNHVIIVYCTHSLRTN